MLKSRKIFFFFFLRAVLLISVLHSVLALNLHPSCGSLCLWLHICGTCSALVMKGMEEVAFESGSGRFPKSNSLASAGRQL